MISPSDLDAIFDAALKSSPDEMCGLLFHGHPFVLCRNVARNPTEEFELNHTEYLEAVKKYRQEPWAIVHSHPGQSARLSVKDCSLLDALAMMGHSLQMVIVGLQPREVKVYGKEDGRYRCAWASTQTIEESIARRLAYEARMSVQSLAINQLLAEDGREEGAL
ncbi:MAG: Mov34/MPN/PAD-1 family protein [Cetobacterium sp.]